MESQRELDGSEALEGKLVVVVVEEGVVEPLWVAVPLVAVVPEPPLVVSQVVAELVERLAGVVPSVYCRPQQIHWFYLVLHLAYVVLQPTRDWFTPGLKQHNIILTTRTGSIDLN